MKKALIIISLVLLSACGNKNIDNNNLFIPKATDTAITQVLYHNPQTNAGTLEQIYRITKDTFTTDKTDKSRNVWYRDTIYFFPLIRDSLDKADKPILDSSGRKKQYLRWVTLDTQYVFHDYNKKF